MDEVVLQRHNPSLVVQQLDDVVDDSALQRPSSSTASSLGNLMVSWMSFAASVLTHDGQVTLIGPDWMTNTGRKALQIFRKYHTKAKEHSKLSDNTTRKTNNRRDTDGVCTENVRKSWEERRIVSHTSQSEPSCRIDAGLPL